MTRTSFVLGIGLFLFLIMLGVLMISDQPHPPQQQHGFGMGKYREKQERMREVAVMRAMAELFPGCCITCRAPNSPVHTIDLRNFQGNAEADAKFDAPMCDSCIRQVMNATSMTLTIKKNRS